MEFPEDLGALSGIGSLTLIFAVPRLTACFTAVP